jgi:hypothetical protein
MKLLIALFSSAFVFLQDTKAQTEETLIGTWDNKSGQILDFDANGKALWIFYSENKRDTFHIQYRTDFSKLPKQIDFTDFKVGPLKGKTLYGIIEITDSKTIRLDFEPTQENRPKAFDPKQSQTYNKI